MFGIPQNQVQPTILFFKKCPVPSQEYGHCYIIVHFCVCYILTLCFCCVYCFLLYLSMNSNYYMTCHGTFLSQIYVFSFDVIFVILIEFCLMLSLFLCVLHFNVVSLFSTIVYYCCLYLLASRNH